MIMLTHCIQVDSLTIISNMLDESICHSGALGLFCRLYSIFDGKFCWQTV